MDAFGMLGGIGYGAGSVAVKEFIKLGLSWSYCIVAAG